MPSDVEAKIAMELDSSFRFMAAFTISEKCCLHCFYAETETPDAKHKPWGDAKHKPWGKNNRRNYNVTVCLSPSCSFYVCKKHELPHVKIFCDEAHEAPAIFYAIRDGREQQGVRSSNIPIDK